MTDEEFTCGHCGRTYRKGRSDEEAAAEALTDFGAPVDDPVLICTECYVALMAWGRRTGELDQERARLRDLTVLSAPAPCEDRWCMAHGHCASELPPGADGRLCRVRHDPHGHAPATDVRG